MPVKLNINIYNRYIIYNTTQYVIDNELCIETLNKLYFIYIKTFTFNKSY